MKVWVVIVERKDRETEAVVFTKEKDAKDNLKAIRRHHGIWSRPDEDRDDSGIAEIKEVKVDEWCS